METDKLSEDQKQSVRDILGLYLRAGEARNVYLCPDCNTMQAHDYIPFGLERGVWYGKCICHNADRDWIKRAILVGTREAKSSDEQGSRLSMQIRLERNDAMSAFGAFLRCEAQHDQSPVIYFNVEACMRIDNASKDEVKRHVITTLMHEFGHVLESHFRLPDNEEAIDAAIDAWQSMPESDVATKG